MKQRPFQQPQFYAYLLRNGPATTRQVMDRLAQPSLSCTFDLLRRMVSNGWATKHGTRSSGFTWAAIPGVNVSDRRGMNGTPNPAGKPRRKRREEPPIVFHGVGRIALEECWPL